MSPRTAEQNSLIREQRKQDILEAALQLFAHTGYSATKIEQIAKKAGTSKGLVYNYFQSKEDILLAIFNRMIDEAETIWQFDSTATPKQQLTKILDATFLYLEEHGNLMKLITQLALQPKVVAELHQMIEQNQAAKLLLMEPILADMGYEKPKEEAFFLGAMLDGISLGAMVLKDDYPFEAIKKRIYKHYDLL